MVNIGKVNGELSRSFLPYFCEFFLVLGRFLRFENPFKYKRDCEINHKAAHPPFAALRRRAKSRIKISHLPALVF
jgi:hypothetical protein